MHLLWRCFVLLGILGLVVPFVSLCWRLVVGDVTVCDCMVGCCESTGMQTSGRRFFCLKWPLLRVRKLEFLSQLLWLFWRLHSSDVSVIFFVFLLQFWINLKWRHSHVFSNNALVFSPATSAHLLVLFLFTFGAPRPRALGLCQPSERWLILRLQVADSRCALSRSFNLSPVFLEASVHLYRLPSIRYQVPPMHPPHPNPTVASWEPPTGQGVCHLVRDCF